MTEEENTTKELKLYSTKAIWIATYLGSPLIAGYLMRVNYLALQEEQKAKNTLWWSILATVLLIIGLLMIPEHSIDRIPSFLIPMLYAGIVYFIVEKKQGALLIRHKELGNEFYSIWKAVGLSLVAVCIFAISFFGLAFLMPNDEVYDQYQTAIAPVFDNEEKTLVFYDHVNTKSTKELLAELDREILPTWKENVQIVKEVSQMQHLPVELVEHHQNLLKYCELRLKTFELMRRAIKENSALYAIELDQLHLEIDQVVEKLN